MPNRFRQIAEANAKEPNNRFRQIAEANDIKNKDGVSQVAQEVDGEKVNRFRQLAKENSSETASRTLADAFSRGKSHGVASLLMFHRPEDVPSDENWLEHVAALAGELIYDIPGFWAGGKMGGAAGALLGSTVPVVGTAAGATSGAVMGAMALPAMIKQASQEYWSEYVDKGGDLSFGDYLNSIGRISKETGKGAVVGLATAGMAKFLPFLKKIPKFNKLLNTKPGKAVATAGLELTGMTGAQGLLEGKRPTAQHILDNVLTYGAIKGTIGAYGKTKSFFGELQKPGTRSTADTFVKMLPEKIQQKIKKTFPKLGVETQRKRLKQIVRDNLGKRNRKVYEIQTKVNEAVELAQKEQKFTAKNLEEMIYYKQKTGNPFVKGDTFKELSKRLPEAAKQLTDGPIKEFFASMARQHNEHPATKNINPRDILRDAYMPGMYEYTNKEFNKAFDKVAAKFGTEVPFAKPKEFLNFLTAFKEAGLKPRYKSIVDFVHTYNEQIIKTLANLDLLEEIQNTQKDNPIPFVVNSLDGKAYGEAKSEGYIPIDNLFLKSYRFEPTVEGKVLNKMWKPSDAPALVHPDFHSALQGVFADTTYRHKGGSVRAWNAYDKATNLIRYTRVELSPFHYVSLFESAVGSGLALKNPFWYKKSGILKNEVAVMSDAIEHGLKVDYRNAKGIKKSFGLIGKGVDAMKKGAELLPDNLASKGANKGLALMSKGANYLFEEFHPRMKIATYQHYVNSEITKQINAGKKFTPEEVKHIKQDIADVVNNQAGGQNLEYMNFWNSSRNSKVLRRLIGYPDWTMSTIRQFLDVFAPGTKGKLGRQFMKRYGIAFIAIHGAFKFFNAGWVQTDKKDKKISGLRFYIDRAIKALTIEGPMSYKFPMPDADVRLPGTDIIFNPGRNAKGEKLSGHFGKQVLEIGRYFTDLGQALFSKAAPLIQMLVEQYLGGTPKGGGQVWVAEPGYKYGQKLAWGGETNTLKQIPSRLKHLIKSALPFSLRTISDKGWGPYLWSMFGAYPVSKAINPHSAIPFIEAALSEKDSVRRKEKLYSIIELMRIGGIPEKTIKSRVSLVRNEYSINQIRDRFKMALITKDREEINAVRKYLYSRGVTTKKFSNLYQKLREEIK